mmetsp:Transcript_25655/g.65952  ORF Transcript_25655/g.65952 Transcript_25655/m.65952 type:complete len:328 (-) Transcript_25655:1158-2141(-)
MLHGVDDPLDTSCADAPEVRAEPESETEVTLRHGGPRADWGWGGRPAEVDPSCPLLDPPPAIVFTHCITPTGRGFGNTSRLPGGVRNCISGCRDDVSGRAGDAVLTLLYGLDALALGPLCATPDGEGIGVLRAMATGVTPPPPAPAATTVTVLSEADTPSVPALGGVTRCAAPAGRTALRAPRGVLNSGWEARPSARGDRPPGRAATQADRGLWRCSNVPEAEELRLEFCRLMLLFSWLTLGRPGPRARTCACKLRMAACDLLSFSWSSFLASCSRRTSSWLRSSAVRLRSSSRSLRPALARSTPFILEAKRREKDASMASWFRLPI